MLKILVLFNIFLLFLSSCSHSADYKLKGISNDLMKWEFCNEKHDLPGLPKYSYTGNICFYHKECKDRWLVKDKCRPILIVCDPANTKCMNKWDIWNKKIK